MSTKRRRGKTSNASDAEITSRITERNRFVTESTPPEVKRLVASSWAPKTQATYNTELKKWFKYSAMNNINPHQPTFDQALDFLVWLHVDQNAKYSTIASARSTMSAFTPMQQETVFGKHPLVSKVIKGMFRERPRIPRKVVIYDTNKVLQYLDSLPDNDSLLLEHLTRKLTTMLCLLSGQRSQSIGYLFPEHMHKSDTIFTFYIPKMLKTTTPMFHQEPLEFEAFPHNTNLCVYKCLEAYLNRTELIRENLPREEGEKLSLILSYQYPNLPVKSATLARYVKDTLGHAGIDVTVFTTHSTRAASTSKGNNMGLSLKEISKAAGWRGESTFQRFYKFKINKNLGTELIKAASFNR